MAMSLRWDAPLTRQLAVELDRRLSGARLVAVRLDGDRRDLVLFFREHTLLWRLHPTRGWPLLRPPGEPAATDLRLAARVRAVVAPDDERLIRIELLPQRARQRATDLVVELLGNQWNAVVCDAADGRIRHVLVTRDGARSMRVGATWSPPPASGRAGRAGDLDRDWWTGTVLVAPPDQRRRTLVSEVAWTSPLNAPALLDVGADAALALHRRLADPDADAEPVVLRTERGLQPYPFPLPGTPSESVASLLDGFERVAAEAGQAAAPEPATLLPPGLVRHLDDTLDAARRRATSLEAERETLPDPGALRSVGDLILARFADVPRGRDSVTLSGFDGQPVDVRLDPAKSPQENADACYEEAARADRAARRLPGLVAEAREEVARLEALDARVRAGTVDAEELEAALPAQGSAGGSVDDGPSLPYRTYRSSGGLEIRVGRGARQNDDLTFHHSAPDDVWLHVQQAAGAHVILRWGRKEAPPSRDLAEAAVLAALGSKARTSGSVPVVWTFRKYVRKPRKSPPGSVVPDRVRTLFVEPDPAMAERLAE